MAWITDLEWETCLAELPVAIREAHSHSIHNRSEIEASDLCGCFYCCSVFPPGEIRDWGNTYEPDTAACPFCGIDSVLGSSSGIPVGKDFLKTMKRHWFH